MNGKRIPECNVNALREKLDKLIARAARKGLSGIGYSFTEPYTIVRDEKDQRGQVVKVSYVLRDLAITGDPPKLAGWQLAAVIEQMDGSPVHMLRVVPGFARVVPDRFRTGNPSACEHCNAHRNRAETFIVWHADRDEYKQVGRRCIRDFLGHDPATMIAWASFMPSLDEACDEYADGDGSCFRSRPSHEVAYIVALAARVVAVDGWKSRSADPERCTAGTIERYLWAVRGHSYGDRETVESFEDEYPVCNRSNGLQDRVMARVAELATKPVMSLDSDYERNLWVCASAGFVAPQHVGLVASMLAYAIKEEERQARSSGLPDASMSKHIGTVGTRLRNLDATVVFTRVFESAYGAKTLVKFVSNGNSLTWWATGCPDIKAGDRVTLTGTVKAHEADKYTQQPTTVISRCDFATVNQTEAA